MQEMRIFTNYSMLEFKFESNDNLVKIIFPIFVFSREQMEHFAVRM